MSPTPCTCRFDSDFGDFGGIVFCPLHAAAGELLEACKRVLHDLDDGDGITIGAEEDMKVAIEKATRRPEEG